MGAPSQARISKWLEEARGRAGLTQRAVSVALDVTEKTVGRWESDEEDTPLPPADQFLQLVWLYGADLTALLPARRGFIPSDEQGVEIEHPATRSAPVPGVPKKRKRA